MKSIKRTLSILLIAVLLLTTAPLTGFDSFFAPNAKAADYAVGDHILTKPAPAYYVDYYRACHILSKALTAGQPPKATYQSGQVWVDMYRDLCEAIQLYPTRPTRDLIFALCAGELGHPRFYITPRTAHKIIYSNLYKIFSL